MSSIKFTVEEIKKCKTTSVVKPFWKKTELIPPDLKTYYKATVMKTVVLAPK